MKTTSVDNETVRGYCIKKIYLVSCDTCNEDITRTIGGDEPTSKAEAIAVARAHQEEWH